VRLVDANVLLYAVNRASPQHRQARGWLDAALNGQEAVAFAWVVLLAFLRLATHRAVFPQPLNIEVAVGIVTDWLNRPAVVVIDPTARHVEVLSSLLTETGSAGNLVNDAHLAALAVEHDAVLVSFDADFGRFAGVRWAQPRT
jgi:toxin-antitoxin system PIN domain toxin